MFLKFYYLQLVDFLGTRYFLNKSLKTLFYVKGLLVLQLDRFEWPKIDLLQAYI